MKKSILLLAAAIAAFSAGTADAAPPSPSTWNIQGSFVPGAAWSMAQPWETLQASGATCSMPGGTLATPYSGGGGAWVGRGTPGSLNLPLVFRAASSSTLVAQGMVIASGQVGLHPSGTDCAMLRFKAPADGIYEVSGEFFAPVDSQTKHPNKVTAYVLDKGVQVATGTVDLPAGVNHWTIPTQTIALKTGETVDFAVDNGGNGFGSDTVLLAGTVKWVDDLPGFKAADFDFEGNHGCAIEKGTSKLFCWGGNGSWMLGKATPASSNVTTIANGLPLVSGETVRAVEVGSTNSCVLTSSLRIICFGANAQMQNGAVPPPNGVNVMPIPPGTFNGWRLDNQTGCLIMTGGGNVRCWGANWASTNIAGMLGVRVPPSITPSASNSAPFPASQFPHSALPAPPIAPITDVANARDVGPGPGSSCAVVGTAANVICWGENIWSSQGVHGNGSGAFAGGATVAATQVRTSYVVLAGTSTPLSGIVRVESRKDRTCALQGSTGTLYCWGINDAYGSLLGATAPNAPSIPKARPIGFPTGVTDFSLSLFGVCVIAGPGGSVLCQGNNHLGQMGAASFVGQNHQITLNPALAGGYGNNTSHLVTSPVLTGARKIRGGNNTFCVLKNDDSIWCWGSNAAGALGANMTPNTSSVTPVRVM